MIAVGVPAYKTNSTNGTREYTGLLGVASTDVPVDDIDKLTLPYKVFFCFFFSIIKWLYSVQNILIFFFHFEQVVGCECVSIYRE